MASRFDWDRRILVRDHETSVHVYRIAQEAIHNAITHGKATEIVVALKRRPSGILRSVRDNGRGLTKASVDSGGMGLENMTYRAPVIGVPLQIATPNEGGTVMNCTLSPG